jgi:hypothetical protein
MPPKGIPNPYFCCPPYMFYLNKDAEDGPPTPRIPPVKVAPNPTLMPGNLTLLLFLFDPPSIF